MSGPTPEDFRGTARFRVERRLGAGAFGVVYEAFDRERRSVVALKTLREADPAALYHFKQEFRALADVAHPNLVTLYELLSEGDQWFFTMELVDGLRFLEYVRGDWGETGPDFQPDVSPTTPVLKAELLDPDSTGSLLGSTAAPRRPLPAPGLDRLRSALAQLAEGITALHQAGKLHRDIKPSNVLVTREGRVVLLDFGLVREVAFQDLTHSVHVVGTPAYMSPEQASGLPVTEASDWYNVGAMLYQALTGDVPFPGKLVQVLTAKQRYEPPPPSTLADGVPEDLDALCHHLLRRDPHARPTGSEVLRSLRGVLVEPRAPGVDRPARGPFFVDRGRELAALEEAFYASREGRAVTVLLHGGSGLGKSALVRRFLDGLRRGGNVVLLAGRCFERESVPYKALDSLVDALSQYLKRLPSAQAEALLPRDLLVLARLFPVLRQVEAVANARRRVIEIPSSQELRRRAFGALRELLSRLAEASPVVLFIDDLQWGDLDSAVLLGDVLRPPDPPPLLLVASYRSEEAETSPFLATLLSARERAGAELDVREVALRELALEDSRELAGALLDDEEPERAESIARESGGNPFFVDELAKHWRSGAGRERHREEQPQETTLDAMIAARVARLPQRARRLLEVVAVAGQPLELNAARLAAEIDHDEQEALTLLRSGHLVRTRGTRSRDEIEAYHNRIREAVVAQISPEPLRAHHLSLALALEASGHGDPEMLAVHFQGAGQAERAAMYAAAAAAQASEALAFDRAARLYRLALELRPAEGEEGRRLRVRLGEALANAGRGAEAARAYLAAAAGAPAAESLELQRRAAEQFLISGHIDEGYAAVRSVLAAIGMRLAETPRQALLSLLLRRAWIRLRGTGFRERDPTQVSAEELIRIDTCWSVSAGLGIVDTIRGADFQARHLLLALEAGEPYRVARALAVEVGYSATAGVGRRARTEALAQQAAALAERIGHPHAVALTTLTRGIAAFLLGRWGEARALSERALGLLREGCTGVTWELDNAQLFSLLSLYSLGLVAEMARRLPALLQEARDRGDLYAETNLTTRTAYLASLAADRPEQARRQVREAIECWSRQAFHLQWLWDFMAQGEIDLYLGDGRAAWARVAERWAPIGRSQLLRIQNTRILCRSLRARSALAASTGGGPGEDLRRAAERDAARIEAEGTHWGAPLAGLIRAGAAAARGRTDDALVHLTAAERGFEGADMALHAAVARRRRGALAGGDEGRALILAAEAWMAGQGIRQPDRMTAMLAP